MMKKNPAHNIELIFCAIGVMLIVYLTVSSFIADLVDTEQLYSNSSSENQLAPPIIPGVTVDAGGLDSLYHSDTQPPRFVYTDGIYINPQAPITNKALLMFTGDLMCGYDMQKAAMSGDTFDFRACFSFVKSTLELSDLTIGSLETMVSQSAPYQYQQKEIPSPGGMQYNCNAPATYLEALRYAGFDALVAANNHNLDAGLTGITETLDNLESYNLLYTGMFREKTDSRFLLFDINGINVAILSYAAAFNTLDGLFDSQALNISLNKYEQNRARADIAAARTAGADFVMVFIHWGKQNSNTVTPSQYAYGQELADAGADYIIGGHPHVLNPYDILLAADGRSVPVIYSLGNFISDMSEIEYSNSDAVIWLLELKKSADSVTIADESYIPCYIFQNLEGQRYVTVPCDSELTDINAIRELNNARERIRRALGDKISETY